MINRRINIVLWGLLAVYTTVTLVLRLAPGVVPFLLGAALLTFLPFVFLFVHGSLNYRFRDMLVFAAITLVVSNIFENLSILTGFPFGHYYYTDTLGPKLFLVPVLIGPAYLGTGYLAWSIGLVVSGAPDSRLPGHLAFSVPLLGAFMVVSWDLSSDRINATVYHGWIWVDGGSYFGVPSGNFLGWLLTTFVFLQLFALYLKRRPNVQSINEQPARIQSLQAILFYGLIAVGYLVNSLTENMSGTVTDPAGMVWRLQDIYAVTALVAIFTMGTFTVLGLVKLMELSPAVQSVPTKAMSRADAPYSLTHRID